MQFLKEEAKRKKQEKAEEAKRRRLELETKRRTEKEEEEAKKRLQEAEEAQRRLAKEAEDEAQRLKAEVEEVSRRADERRRAEVEEAAREEARRRQEEMQRRRRSDAARADTYSLRQLRSSYLNDFPTFLINNTLMAVQFAPSERSVANNFSRPIVFANFNVGKYMVDWLVSGLWARRMRISGSKKKFDLKAISKLLNHQTFVFAFLEN